MTGGPAEPGRRGLRRALGALGAAGYVIHVGFHAAHGRPEDALWVCHLAALAVAGGMALGWPRLNAAGLLCLLVGNPVWVGDLLGGSTFYPTSLLTHGLGMALGLAGARMLGAPRRAWVGAWALAAAALLAARVATPAASNVNLIFAPPALWTWAPRSAAPHAAWLVCYWGASLFFAEALLRWAWIRKPPAPSPVPAG